MVRPAYLVAVEMSAARKTELRTYFARTLDDQYDTDEITQWINDVGQIMGKQDIIDDAQNVATYLMEEKGYQGGLPSLLRKPNGGHLEPKHAPSGSSTKPHL